MSRATGTLISAAVACAVLAACDRDPPRPAATAAVNDSTVADSVFEHDEERVTLPSSRIYYTLTSYDWYARGQPLLHDGRAYTPQGLPIPASLEEMTRVGEFEGVEYYERAGDSSPAVFVPVFQGYWQQFRLDPTASPAPVDDAAPADPADSTAA